MNIHLLLHKTANHNILATELLVEVANMKDEQNYLPWCTWGQVRTFGDLAIQLAVLKSSLLNGIVYSLGKQHGVPGWDGGANSYPTALPRRQILCREW